MCQGDTEQDIKEVCSRWRDEIKYNTSTLKELITYWKDKWTNNLIISCWDGQALA